jgi:flagellar hook assembly protein FlgD
MSPNPFNPITTIHYTLPVDAQVKISIFNIRGQLVNVIWNEVTSAGYKTVVWDGHDSSKNVVGSGIYFVQIQSDQVMHTGKVTFLK